MESRKSRNVCIPEYFMAVRKCIHILGLYELEVLICLPGRISANHVTAKNINVRMNHSSYLF